MMSRRSCTCLGVAALAVAALLVAAEPASAQRWRGRNPNYSGYGWSNYGYGWGNYPMYYGQNYPAYWNYYGWGNYPAAQWYGPGTQWYSSESTGAAPSYYSEEYPAATGGAGYSSQAYGAMAGTMDHRVLINLRLPPNAEVWFDDQKTTETGPFRSYITPPLNPNRDFVYHIRVRWMENGRTAEKDRRIDVHAGDRLFFTFLPSATAPAMGGTAAGQYGTPGQYGEQQGTAQPTSRPHTPPSTTPPAERTPPPKEKE
jgi:uncharacterized protein (TIGR03000 family)